MRESHSERNMLEHTVKRHSDAAFLGKSVFLFVFLVAKWPTRIFIYNLTMKETQKRKLRAPPRLCRQVVGAAVGSSSSSRCLVMVFISVPFGLFTCCLLPCDERHCIGNTTTVTFLGYCQGKSGRGMESAVLVSPATHRAVLRASSRADHMIIVEIAMKSGNNALLPS